jgi:hypothetical protein
VQSLRLNQQNAHRLFRNKNSALIHPLSLPAKAGRDFFISSSAEKTFRLALPAILFLTAAIATDFDCVDFF